MMDQPATEEAYDRLAAHPQPGAASWSSETRRAGRSPRAPRQLTMENLANVIELWTKIPASQIQEQ